MDSKLDESTGETSAGNAFSCSVIDNATADKSKECETGQYGSVNSSCDSVSGNAKWKPSSSVPNGSSASFNVSLFQKFDCSKGSESFHEASVTDLSSQNTVLMEIPTPTNMKDADHLIKDGKSIPLVQPSKYLEEDSRDGVQLGMLKCRDEDSNLVLAKGVESNSPSGDPPAICSNSGEENEDVDKSFFLSEMKDTSRSHLVDDSNDSDIVEQDVKVCDICGDAGREDLLAICCRCSDGAEHTYCMRERLEKVPEGYWMCEECQFDEEIKNQRQDRVVKVDGNDKKFSSSKSYGGNSNSCLKLEAKGADEVDTIIKNRSNMKILGKRHKDDFEVSSLAKKHASESVLGSPKKSSYSSVASLSRDNSLRHLDRGKEKLTHQFSSGALLVNDDNEPSRTPATGARSLTTQGTFLKSNSFSSLNAKPKVKLVDEVVPLKQKSGKEPSQLDVKEGSGKSFGKSMTFRTMSSGRLGTGESKVKMLSPSFSHNQDHKGFKHSKERAQFERKSSFRSERPSLNSPRVSSSISSSKSDQKLACQGETAVSSVSNNRQSRAVQSDGKSAALSKSSSLATHRASEVPVFSGEVKRQSSVANEHSAPEQKSSHKDDPLISQIADNPNFNSNESPHDGSSRPKEFLTVGEKLRDDGHRLKQNVAIGGRTDICQRCKEVGHLTQCCPVDGSPPDGAASKSSREVTDGSSDLKAAIEAAMLRKPSICRKYRVADLSSESQASKNGEVISQNSFSSSVSRNSACSGEVNELLKAMRYSTDSCKEAAIDNVKQFASLYVETLTSRTGDGGLVVLDDGRTPLRDLPSHSSTAISILWKLLTIPEHEFIWQGNFEVRRSEKVEYCDGMQAYLSTYASPRVLGVVNTFPYKIVLEEVPRLSTWPIQFQEYGVKDNNVALYFFAKDVDSYEKSYKILLDNMIKNDLALKGIIDGVELLIFPSTQLPEQLQRWNMLYFLWGVFRGKKTSCYSQLPGSPNQYFTHQDIPSSIIPLPESACSLGQGLSTDASLVAKVPDLEDGFGVSRESSLVKMEDAEQINVEKQDNRLCSNCFSSLQTHSINLCQEIRFTSSSQEGGADSKCKVETGEVMASVQASERNVSCESECMRGLPDNIPSTGEKVPSQGVTEGVVSDKLSCSADQVNHGKIIGDVPKKEEACLGRDSVTREQIRKDLNSCQWRGGERKRPHRDSMIISEAICTSTRQTVKIDDDESEDVIVLGTSKRQKTGSDGLYGSNDRSSLDGFTMRIHGVASGSPINGNDEACEEEKTVRSESGGSAERYFFPVDPHPVKDIGLVDKSKRCPLEDQVQGGIPNLDLALGGETSQILSSFVVEKKVEEDHHPEKAAKEDEDDMSGSLSLSLSFPFSDKEQNTSSISKTEQLRTERRHQVNTASLLFGGIRDK